MTIDITAAVFAGTWQLRKTIRQAGQSEATFEGTAQWDAVEGRPDHYSYYEAGHLSLQGHTPLQAERRYRWVGLDVFFDDGRFFHRVPTDGREAVHLCDPDTYRVRYAFGDWPRFEMRWRVTGPRKDYKMTAVYERP